MKPETNDEDRIKIQIPRDFSSLSGEKLKEIADIYSTIQSELRSVYRRQIDQILKTNQIEGYFSVVTTLPTSDNGYEIAFNVFAENNNGNVVDTIEKLRKIFEEKSHIFILDPRRIDCRVPNIENHFQINPPPLTAP